MHSHILTEQGLHFHSIKKPPKIPYTTGKLITYFNPFVSQQILSCSTSLVCNLRSSWNVHIVKASLCLYRPIQCIIFRKGYRTYLVLIHLSLSFNSKFNFVFWYEYLYSIWDKIFSIVTLKSIVQKSTRDVCKYLYHTIDFSYPEVSFVLSLLTDSYHLQNYTGVQVKWTQREITTLPLRWNQFIATVNEIWSFCLCIARWQNPVLIYKACIHLPGWAITRTKHLKLIQPNAIPYLIKLKGLMCIIWNEHEVT